MLVGHIHEIRLLKKLADNGNLSHAYLFSGPAMVGKRLVAESFANYLESGEFAKPNILIDGTVITPNERGTIGIDEARRVKEFLWQKPAKSPRRTAIIDRAERLTAEAQNALLKISEEPPASSLLILVTSDEGALFETLRSRFHNIYFSQVPEREIAAWLKDEMGFGSGDAEKFAQSSFGKPGFAVALKNDEKLKELLSAAKHLLSIGEDARANFIKELIAPEEFNLNDFLDAVILIIAVGNVRVGLHEVRAVPRMWHKLLELRSRSANFSLNPKLQLEALFSG